jgi:hypothetical protein
MPPSPGETPKNQLGTAQSTQNPDRRQETATTPGLASGHRQAGPAKAMHLERSGRAPKEAHTRHRGNAPQEPTADLQGHQLDRGLQGGQGRGRPPPGPPSEKKRKASSDRPTPEKDQRPKPGEQRGQDQKNGGSQEQHWLAQLPGQAARLLQAEAQADPMEVRPHNLHHPQMLTQPCPQPPPTLQA